MKLIENVQIVKIQETVVKSNAGHVEKVIAQLRESYKGVSFYRVFYELKFDGNIVDIVECNSTFDRNASDDFFYDMERKYPEDKRKRTVF